MPLTIDGKTATATSPEGRRAELPLAKLLDLARPPRPDTGPAALPDGVKFIFSRGNVVLWFHQQPPCRRSLKWIAADSPKPYGPKATFRDVTLALPYVVVAAAFDATTGILFGHNNEAFFSNKPLESWDDPLCFPALLNVSRHEVYPVGDPAVPLAWICTQHLDLSPLKTMKDAGRRARKGLGLLLNCLWDTGFNLSSEHHEGNSWFSMSKERDKRIASVEAWETASKEDPSFATDVPWCPTNLSVRGVADHILNRMAANAPPPPSTAADLERLAFNHAK